MNKVVDWFKKQGTPDAILLSTIMLAGIEKHSDENSRCRFWGFFRERIPSSIPCSRIPERSLEPSCPRRCPFGWLHCPQSLLRKIDGGATQDLGRLRSTSPQRNHLEWFLSAKGSPEIPTLGYLARLCPLKGLDLLVDAYVELKAVRQARELAIGNRRRDDRGRRTFRG